MLSLILLIGLFTWFYPARIVRSLILSLRGARVRRGGGDGRVERRKIMRTHLFPHVLPALAVWATLAVATNIMLEAGITFLGVGIKLPTSSWGTMLAATWGTVLSRNTYNPSTFSPWLTLIPSARDLPHRARADAVRRGSARGVRPEGDPVTTFGYALRRLGASILLLLLLSFLDVRALQGDPGEPGGLPRGHAEGDAGPDREGGGGAPSP